MTIRLLDKTNYKGYAPLLLPEAVEGIAEGTMLAYVAFNDEDKPCGAVAGKFLDLNSFVIFSLYVLPSDRRKGVASELLAEIESQVDDYEVPYRMVFTVEDENQATMLKFLESTEYVEDDDEFDQVFMFTLEDIKASELMKKDSGNDKKTFAQIDKKLFDALEAEHKKRGDYIPEGGFLGDNIMKDISCANITDNEITSYAVIEKIDDGKVRLASLWSKEVSPMTVFSLLRSAFHNASERLDKDTKVLMHTTNEDSYRIVMELFKEDPEPDKMGEEEDDYDDEYLKPYGILHKYIKTSHIPDYIEFEEYKFEDGELPETEGSPSEWMQELFDKAKG
ncbi:MAG: GNAT family N-acetyltransferase [Lachnospiraceae bacterium]|nr:GNAT family N-acetyltransferase [Lachnospiraceae bacterium]